jgi:hypothetical protein
MLVLAGVAAVGLVGAVLGTLVVWHWPKRHLDAPSLETSRISHLLSSHHHLAAVLRRDVDPTVATTLVLAAAFMAIVGVAALVGILHLIATTDELTGRTDAPLAAWAATHSSDAATSAIQWLSWLGGTSAVVLVAVAVAIVEVRRTPTWMIPGFLALTVGGQFAIVNGIKVVVDRARPDVLRLSRPRRSLVPRCSSGVGGHSPHDRRWRERRPASHSPWPPRASHSACTG